MILMIYDLRESEFTKVQPLFKKLSFTLSDDAVINRIRPGKIYVDNLKNPKTAFLWAKPSEFCLSGSPDNDQFNSSLKNLVDEKITPELLRHNIKFSVLYYSSADWDCKIKFILKSQSSKKNYRWLHTFKQQKFSWKGKIPPSFHVERIDELFLRSKKLQNINNVIEFILFNWNSVENFIQKGFGFCLLCGDEIVSWCISGDNVGKKCKLTIGTNEKYRNKGFASLIASIFLEYCLNTNLIPVWHCGTENLASIAVAEKIGFEKEQLYPVYTWNPKKSAYLRWLLKNKPNSLIPTVIQFSRNYYKLNIC